MSNLNQKQKEAVEYNDGHLLIVAGAGTGKTTVITEKIAYLITTKGVSPEHILALTFTDKASREMQDRVDSLLGSSFNDVQISTFHSFCQKILEEYGLEIGISNRFKLLSTTDTWILVREHLNAFDLSYYKPLGDPSRYIYELIAHFNKCKDELVSAEDYLNFAQEESKKDGESVVEESGRLYELAKAYFVYNQLLLNSNYLDFGDLIFYTIKLLRTRPGLRKKIQNRFQYVLVDEFQDVNWAQYKLIELLVGENSRLTVVGDDDQSIYAFRGASVSNILRFKDDFPSANSIVLIENFRSHQSILDTAYELIQKNNPDRLETKLSINKRLVSSNNENTANQVFYFHASNAEDEVDYIVNKIIEIKNSASDIQWKDFAILVRAHNHGELIGNVLEKQHIPFDFLSSAGLLKQSIVLDCISFFKSVTEINDSVALYRLLNIPCFDIDAYDLQKIIFFAKKKSITYFEALKRSHECRLSEEGEAKAQRIISLLEEGFRNQKIKKPSTCLLLFLENSGYLKYLAKQESRGESAIMNQLSSLKQFFEFIAEYEAASSQTSAVPNLLRHIDFLLEAGDELSLQPTLQEDALRIMTVHASKGLEFKFVFIINTVEERFPLRRRKEAIEIPEFFVREQLPKGDAHYQEERRLFYVALTRAKLKVFITNSEDYGGSRQRKISRFIDEAGINNAVAAESDMAETFLEKIKKGGTSFNTQEDAFSISQPVYPTPKAFSFSQLKSYEACPYQYKLAHIVKLPTKGSASFSFGQTMHATLQKFYQKIQEMNSVKQAGLFDNVLISQTKNISTVKSPSFEELIKIYEESWIDDWYNDKIQKQAYFDKGKKILKELYVSQNDQWNIPVSLEGWFKIKLGDYFLHGRIDRIDQLTDGSLEIIDYKTGTSKQKVVGEEKDQLLIYQIATTQLPQFSLMGKTSKLTFFYLNDNTKVSFLGSSEEIEGLKTKLLENILEIKKGNFSATPNPFTCSFCQFKDICEYRTL